ncbi:hypothetical protein BLM15_30270 (plasmid) [Bosea sp. Tri-49]|nr:hypothetical protein BLM15_30270 [Bosea sp. Tri-49]
MCRKQQPADAAKRRAGRLIADDKEGVRLDAFDLEPVTTAAGAIGRVAPFGDNAFKTEPAGLYQECRAVRFWG